MAKTASGSLLLVGLLAGSLAACAGSEGGQADDAAQVAGEEAASAPAQEDVSMLEEMPDMVDPTTGYNATAQVACGFAGEAPTGNCEAGVKRNWGEDGATLVEVTKPDGFKRAIYFNGTEPFGADSSQADGSAGWDFETTRDGDRVTISYGPETYVIVDAFVEGG